MKPLIAEFVQTCPLCQQIKRDRCTTKGLLQPIPLLKRKWQPIAIDWVLGLHETWRKGFVYDSILTVVDRATKMVHLLPTQTNCSAILPSYCFPTYSSTMDFLGASFLTQMHVHSPGKHPSRLRAAKSNQNHVPRDQPTLRWDAYRSIRAVRWAWKRRSTHRPPTRRPHQLEQVERIREVAHAELHGRHP